MESCTNYTPTGFTGHWRDWHRGHGCDLDDGKPRSATARRAAEEPEPAPDQPDFKHCDDYISDLTQPKCLRLFLIVNRLPAVDRMLVEEAGFRPELYADHDGRRVRVVMASRIGDVGISSNLESADGYETRVAIEALANFHAAPHG